MAKHQLRIDLTDYEPYIDMLVDRLNQDSVRKMSRPDVIKILIEKAMDKLSPDVRITKTRRLYETLKF